MPFVLAYCTWTAYAPAGQRELSTVMPAEASEALMPRRRLSDLLLAFDFCEVQIEVLLRTAKPHRARDVNQRLAVVYHRIDSLERDIRHHALELGEDGALPIADLRKRLRQIERRATAHLTEYGGRERRRRFRRRTDILAGDVPGNRI